MKSAKPRYILYYFHKIIGRIVKTYVLIDINGRKVLYTTDKNKVRITLDLIGLNNYKKVLRIDNRLNVRKSYQSASIEYYER